MQALAKQAGRREGDARVPRRDGVAPTANGTYVTSSTFTADAATFAKANGIQTQDGAALLKLIGQRTPGQQAALLAVAYEGAYWRPTCASCGTKMVERTSRKNARAFWGCANYPRCSGRTVPKASMAVA